MKKILIFTSLLLASMWSQSLLAASNHLVLTGSSTVAPLALEIGKRFEKLNQGVRVDVQTGGSSRGVNDARMKLADIGMASRALKANESDLTAIKIANDGITIILHSSNRVANLSDEQIVAIYTGKIRNWREVGGSDQPITVVNKAEGHSTLELFLHHFHLKNSQVKADAVIGDNEQGIKTVAANRGAIGYVSIGTASYDAEHGVPIQLLPMNGVTATIEHVRDASFPLSRPLNLVVNGKPGELAQRFINFARSPAVTDLVESLYFVPLEH
ncbi:MAG: phosphate ABC transporter substrate-binding protein [Mariprofundus sp.]|nr:phosphate ABC transporter substrate-binding protein [Mariprofundus sp.]